MNTRIALSTVALAGAVIALGQISGAVETGIAPQATPGSQPDDFNAKPTGDLNGPDVVCWEIDGLSNWASGGFRAYSVGTTSCNLGAENLIWTGGNNEHPVIGQSMYRWKVVNGHGRFEQIGQSWLKHGFCALDQTECGPCKNGTGCASLAPGCSDPYTAGRNGSQGSAGPKYQVDATTGIFPYPPANPSWSGNTARRLRVADSDVVAAQNPGARYFIEAQYIHKDDSPASFTPKAGNNASYREVNLSDNGTATGYLGFTKVKDPGILAWKLVDPLVQMTKIRIDGEGTMRVASRAYANGDGTWDYEYAIHNLNIDKSIGAFSVPVDPSLTITDIGFNDVDYHSGEPWDGTDWVGTRSAGVVSWETESEAQNSNANAIRWGTTYNFRFTADAPPATVDSTVGMWKAGIGDQTAAVQGPVIGSPTCPGDVDGNDSVGFEDLLTVLSSWGPCVGCPADVTGDGSVSFEDLLTVLSSWGPCP